MRTPDGSAAIAALDAAATGAKAFGVEGAAIGFGVGVGAGGAGGAIGIGGPVIGRPVMCIVASSDAGMDAGIGSGDSATRPATADGSWAATTAGARGGEPPRAPIDGDAFFGALEGAATGASLMRFVIGAMLAGGRSRSTVVSSDRSISDGIPCAVAASSAPLIASAGGALAAGATPSIVMLRFLSCFERASALRGIGRALVSRPPETFLRSSVATSVPIQKLK